MEYKIIKTQEQYIEYNNELDNQLNRYSNSGDIELLSILINKWEDEQLNLGNIDNPINYINSCIKLGLINKKKLINVLGDKTITSRILNKKRSLNLKQIRILHENFKIPVDILIKEYKLNV